MRKVTELLNSKECDVKVHGDEHGREWFVFCTNLRRYILEYQQESYRLQVEVLEYGVEVTHKDWATILCTKDEDHIVAVIKALHNI